MELRDIAFYVVGFIVVIFSTIGGRDVRDPRVQTELVIILVMIVLLIIGGNLLNKRGYLRGEIGPSR
ncbi:MAG TPA: hypothetical protein VM050_02165 [Patescibacteria group bacterium]|nr:hypothetical protein [Patescibacteria group bacterium]